MGACMRSRIRFGRPLRTRRKSPPFPLSLKFTFKPGLERTTNTVSRPVVLSLGVLPLSCKGTDWLYPRQASHNKEWLYSDRFLQETLTT